MGVAATLAISAGGEIVKSGWILPLFLRQLAFNVASKQLWWRSHLLPRPGMARGRRAWLAHGLLW